MVTPRQRPTDRQLPVNGLSTPGAHIQTRQPVSGTTVTPERTAETRWRPLPSLSLAPQWRKAPWCSSPTRPTGERNAAPARTRKTKSVFFFATSVSSGSTHPATWFLMDLVLSD